uniref:Uncharacterized protein n=1 Tax=Panagrolaimus sp. PS1159 TaxID=55785 RepID=A0AC35FUM4_9BILA
MVVAGYLLNNPYIRITDGKTCECLKFQNKIKGKSEKELAENVFKLVPKKMKNLVIVNSTLSTFEMIQACVEVADKYSENVMVIPPLLARITYGLEFLSRVKNFPKNEVIIFVTITEAFCEFVILQRNSDLQLFISECEIYELKQCNEMFEKWFNKFHPTSSVFVFHDKFEKIPIQLEKKFNLRKCFMRPYKMYEYVLLMGAMLRAMGDEDGFNSKYHIANFSNGFETTIMKKRHVLLADRSSIPSKIYGINGSNQQIKIAYFGQFQFRDNEFKFCKQYGTPKPLLISGSSEEIIGYIDERGIPYSPAPKFILDNEKPKLINVPDIKTNETNAIVNFSKSTPYSLTSSQPISSVSSFQSSLSINNFQVSAPSPRQIKFVFRDNFYSVEISRNGITRVLANCFGKEWTPLYFSMANGVPEFGEIAKIHCEKFPKHVIYDLWEVIGKSMYEIKINPKWGFQLIVENGIVYFQIETLFGPRLFPQEMIIAAFLKDMKIRVESNLDAKINEISISTNFELNETQKNIFKKASMKNDLEISSFVFNIV